MKVKNFGLIAYDKALHIMEEHHAEVVENADHEGYLLVLQHPPTVTMGKRELLDDMKLAPEELKFKGVSYHKIDRGGSVTVHEPGQIVIYPIVNIHKYKHSVRSFVCALEQAMIETCAHFNIIATRDSINAGVWVGENKIGAIGIRVANKVTKHGLALNIINSLNTFSYIIPCGLRGRGVTNFLTFQKNISNYEDFYFKVEEYLVKKVLTLLIRHSKVHKQ